MIINGLEKLSLVDFDGHLCCTTFSSGCNFKCPFCHNSALVLDGKNQPTISEEDFFKFLNKRKGIIDGVCISGGEPTLQKDLESFITKIRELGFLVKLDTNGTNPKIIKDFTDKMLLDFIAMDIKNSPKSYSKTVGLENFDIDAIKESVALLISRGSGYEFRTTLVKELHSEQDIIDIALWLKGSKKYFLQKFKDIGTCIEGGLHEVEKETVLHWSNDILKKTIEEVNLRGYD